MKNSCRINKTCMIILFMLMTSQSTEALDYSAALKLLPAKASVMQTLLVDFKNNGSESLAIAYKKPVDNYPSYLKARTTSGLLIVTYKALNGWKILHHEPAGPGSSDSIECGILKGKNNLDALFVQYWYSGAGVSADWSLFTFRDNKLSSFDRMPILEKVLKAKDYVFNGYNSATIIDDSVIEETIGGYSKEASRCCSDRPALIVHYIFTGSSIEVISVVTKDEADDKADQPIFNNSSQKELTQLTEDEAKAFISKWLKLSEDNRNITPIMTMYSKNVLLYKFGAVNKSLVAKDKEAFFKKWPTRKYAVQYLSVSPGKSVDEKQVQITYHFTLTNNKKTITGNAKSSLDLRKQNSTILITSENGDVL